MHSLVPHVEQWSTLDNGRLVITGSPKLNEERGLIDFFANNFTCTGAPNSRSNLFWVPGNFNDLLNVNTARYSVLAVGAMALARLRRSPYYLREAQRMYSTAVLSLTNNWNGLAISDKEAVYTAILFLSFFEVLALYDLSSRQSWMTHLRGIGGLLQTEDSRPMRTEFAACMLLQSRSQVIMNALQTKTPVTGVFASSDLPVLRAIPPRLRASVDLDSLLIHLAGLQAQAQNAQTDIHIIDGLKVLQRDLIDWPRQVPSSWSYSQHDLMLPGQHWWASRCDIYPTTLVANVWNKYRAARIITYDLLTEKDSMHTMTIPREPGSATIAPGILSPEIRDLIADICATVPRYYRPDETHTAHDIQDKPLLGTTYWLLWVLPVSCSMKESPVELVLWVQKCLERIFDCTGIMVAHRVAARLQMRLDGSCRQI